jgi:hypothetical protein
VGIFQEIMNSLPLVLGIALNVERELYLAKHDHQLREFLLKELNHGVQAEIELLVRFTSSLHNNQALTMD